MLSPERAQELLEEHRIDDPQARVDAALRDLPGEVARAGTELVGWIDPWGPAPDGSRIDNLSGKRRVQLFEALFPHLGHHVEAMWQGGAHLPYQRWYGRRGFRVPSEPEVSLPLRWQRLRSMIWSLEHYEAPSAAWVARWAPHLSRFGGVDAVLGTFLAAVIDAGGPDGDAVFDTLVASGRGDDEVGAMGDHVIRGLLTASREDGWQFVEQLLLAGQREEGLRQRILEAVDEAHPQAFRALMGTILEQNLTRFSATTRAVDVWLGAQFTSRDARAVNAALERVLRYWDDLAERRTALAHGSGEDVYLALWTTAHTDATEAIEPARRLLRDPDPERRWAAAHLLTQLELTTALDVLATALEDEDMRVAARALDAFRGVGVKPRPGVFERLERLMARVPKKAVRLDPIVWSWTAGKLERRAVGEALAAQAVDRPVTDMLPYLDLVDADTRSRVAARLAEGTPRGAVRRTVVSLLGDPSSYVRERALEGTAKLSLDDLETREVEGLLNRKAGDLRRGVVALLLARPDDAALGSADRLLASGNASQRMGGLEILRRLVEEERVRPDCRARAAAYRDRHDELTEAERKQLDAILGDQREAPTRENALGLLDPTGLTPLVAPATRDVALVTPAAIACLRSLDALVHEHRDEEIEQSQHRDDGRRELLGDAPYFPQPSRNKRDHPAVEGSKAVRALEQGVASLPLAGVWVDWARTRPAATRDDDGFELLRALETPVDRAAGARYWHTGREAPVEAFLCGPLKAPAIRYPAVVLAIVEWLAMLELPDRAPGFLLDAAETMLAARPDAAGGGWLRYLERARETRHHRLDGWSHEDQARLWRLECWAQKPATTGRRGRSRPPPEELIAACRAGVATDADVIDGLLGPRTEYGRGFLESVSGRRLPGWASAPRLGELVSHARNRILEIELRRGEAPTAASPLALNLEYSGGLEVLGVLLTALGREPFVRGWSYDGESRQVVFSSLIRATFPGAGDTPDAFAAEMGARKVGERRLLELAAFAPQWVRHVEHTLGWSGLASGIWWLHAHTKDDRWEVAREIREAWAAEAAERTPLHSDELLDGAVDVDWFQSVYADLGPERWKELQRAAKYGSSSGGHKRAQLYADSMRGAVKEGDLRTRIDEKRHQDAVRALGLLPLPRGRRRELLLLARYESVQAFVQTSRQFGSQRQASERRAAEIGLENLARTAGYKDPIRLGWAMEARGIADLADGPLTVSTGGVEVTLEIDADGTPQMHVSRDGHALKAVPAAAGKLKDVKALRARRTGLKRQASRVRESLELAMVRGDVFGGSELHDLSSHALLAPQLGRLVLVGDDGVGYLDARGRVLCDATGAKHALGAEEPVRIAHPLDLAEAGWTQWQRDALHRQVRQPFKQVFRELYVPTQAELAEGGVSRRYAGNQVQPGRALALLGRRGWVVHPEEGVRRTFHDAKLSAQLLFLGDVFTPAEVEDLTVEEVRFARAGEWEPVPIPHVPRRIFSEVMRDLDLVVSVAHSGGVDPETSSSTIEMRAALLEETCGLLDVENVGLKGSWAIVDGRLGEYSVHMGSGVVHRRPGGAVCIIPVHGQHRGRIFLPFADDDPKTAEVMAKVLLLARDDQIKDPTILEQIRG